MPNEQSLQSDIIPVDKLQSLLNRATESERRKIGLLNKYPFQKLCFDNRICDYTQLMLAVKSGYASVVEYLVIMRAVNIRTFNSNRENALYFAVELASNCILKDSDDIKKYLDIIKHLSSRLDLYQYKHIDYKAMLAYNNSEQSAVQHCKHDGASNYNYGVLTIHDVDIVFSLINEYYPAIAKNKKFNVTFNLLIDALSPFFKLCVINQESILAVYKAQFETGMAMWKQHHTDTSTVSCLGEKFKCNIDLFALRHAEIIKSFDDFHGCCETFISMVNFLNTMRDSSYEESDKTAQCKILNEDVVFLRQVLEQSNYNSMTMLFDRMLLFFTLSDKYIEKELKLVHYCETLKEQSDEIINLLEALNLKGMGIKQSEEIFFSCSEKLSNFDGRDPLLKLDSEQINDFKNNERLLEVLEEQTKIKLRELVHLDFVISNTKEVVEQSHENDALKFMRKLKIFANKAEKNECAAKEFLRQFQRNYFSELSLVAGEMNLMWFEQNIELAQCKSTFETYKNLLPTNNEQRKVEYANIMNAQLDSLKKLQAKCSTCLTKIRANLPNIVPFVTEIKFSISLHGFEDEKNTDVTLVDTNEHQHKTNCLRLINEYQISKAQNLKAKILYHYLHMAHFSTIKGEVGFDVLVSTHALLSDAVDGALEIAKENLNVIFEKIKCNYLNLKKHRESVKGNLTLSSEKLCEKKKEAETFQLTCPASLLVMLRDLNGMCNLLKQKTIKEKKLVAWVLCEMENADQYFMVDHKKSIVDIWLNAEKLEEFKLIIDTALCLIKRMASNSQVTEDLENLNAWLDLAKSYEAVAAEFDDKITRQTKWRKKLVANLEELKFKVNCFYNFRDEPDCQELTDAQCEQYDETLARLEKCCDNIKMNLQHYDIKFSIYDAEYQLPAGVEMQQYKSLCKEINKSEYQKTRYDGISELKKILNNMSKNLDDSVKYVLVLDELQEELNKKKFKPEFIEMIASFNTRLAKHSNMVQSIFNLYQESKEIEKSECFQCSVVDETEIDVVQNIRDAANNRKNSYRSLYTDCQQHCERLAIDDISACSLAQIKGNIKKIEQLLSLLDRKHDFIAESVITLSEFAENSKKLKVINNNINCFLASSIEKQAIYKKTLEDYAREFSELEGKILKHDCFALFDRAETRDIEQAVQKIQSELNGYTNESCESFCAIAELIDTGDGLLSSYTITFQFNSDGYKTKHVSFLVEQADNNTSARIFQEEAIVSFQNTASARLKKLKSHLSDLGRFLCQLDKISISEDTKLSIRSNWQKSVPDFVSNENAKNLNALLRQCSIGYRSRLNEISAVLTLFNDVDGSRNFSEKINLERKKTSLMGKYKNFRDTLKAFKKSKYEYLVFLGRGFIYDSLKEIADGEAEFHEKFYKFTVAYSVLIAGVHSKKLERYIKEAKSKIINKNSSFVVRECRGRCGFWGMSEEKNIDEDVDVFCDQLKQHHTEIFEAAKTKAVELAILLQSEIFLSDGAGSLGFKMSPVSDQKEFEQNDSLFEKYCESFERKHEQYVQAVNGESTFNNADEIKKAKAHWVNSAKILTAHCNDFFASVVSIEQCYQRAQKCIDLTSLRTQLQKVIDDNICDLTGDADAKDTGKFEFQLAAHYDSCLTSLNSSYKAFVVAKREWGFGKRLTPTLHQRRQEKNKLVGRLLQAKQMFEDAKFKYDKVKNDLQFYLGNDLDLFCDEQAKRKYNDLLTCFNQLKKSKKSLNTNIDSALAVVENWGQQMKDGQEQYKQKIKCNMHAYAAHITCEKEAIRVSNEFMKKLTAWFSDLNVLAKFHADYIGPSEEKVAEQACNATLGDLEQVCREYSKAQNKVEDYLQLKSTVNVLNNLNASHKKLTETYHKLIKQINLMLRAVYLSPLNSRSATVVDSAQTGTKRLRLFSSNRTKMHGFKYATPLLSETQNQKNGRKLRFKFASLGS